MDNYLEKEFSIGEVMSLLILRNDFDDIGSVLKMTITQNISSLHSIAISFYTENKIQINQSRWQFHRNLQEMVPAIMEYAGSE